MCATLVPPYRVPFRPPQIHRKITMQSIPRRSPFILSVLSTEKNINTTPGDDRTEQTIYNDNWFDRAAINHLSNSLQSSTGMKSKKSGYDGLVEAATVASRRFSAAEQREVVTQTLVTAFPRPIMSLIKMLLPPSKFSREYYAVFTTIFFTWLVGPCQVRESEFEGRTEKNVVYIPKCRFLEETNCVGMCTNLCKMPSQAFIKESMGMPFTMVPNFEDMSCEMIFGQEPPTQENDPAFAQPCYKQCKEKYKHQAICTSE